MDSSQRYSVFRPCPLHHHHSLFPSYQHTHSYHRHHHHHHHLLPNCPLHGFLLQPNSHSKACPLFVSPHPLPQNPEPVASVPSANHLKLQLSETDGTPADALMTQDENEELEVEDEEDDPVFVLTDEWREFFAKSEAKRRLAKQEAKKKGKKK